MASSTYFTFDRSEDYLIMEISGSYDHSEFMDFPVKILNECKRQDLHKVLVDLRYMSGSITISERYFLGEQIAKVLTMNVKMGVIWLEEEINHFAENVAVNRGGNMQMFDDLELAKQWLLTE